MSPYAVALFCHVVGALGLFVAMGFEWLALWQLRRVVVAEQAREWLGIFGLLPMLYPPTGILLMLSGLYMTTIVWGWQAAWPRVSLVAMVLLAIIGGAVTGPRLGALARAAADEQGPLSSGLRARLQAPRLLVSVQFRAAIALGNVCLMTLKPSLGGALFTLGVALTAGLAAAAQAIRHTDSHGVPEHQG